MNRTPWIATLAACALAAAPAAADRVLTVKSHVDEMSMMGQTTPAKDEVHKYWFGADAVRYDMGEQSYLVHWGDGKMYVIDHARRKYSPIDLPIELKKLVPPEMVPMLEQMASMMGGSAKVTPSDRTGSFGGFDCKYYRTDVTMAMMSIAMDSCVSKQVPLDLGRYRQLVESQAQLMPNTQWMSELAKIEGFPVRSDTTTSVMGKSFMSWQEIVSSEDQPAPAGAYAPPAGYAEEPFDPLGQGRRGPRRR
jgi:hypothetical protein